MTSKVLMVAAILFCCNTCSFCQNDPSFRSGNYANIHIANDSIFGFNVYEGKCEKLLLDSGVIIPNSKISCPLVFDALQFTNLFFLSNDSLMENVEVDNTTFKKSSAFSECIFRKTLTMWSSTFTGTPVFAKSEFQSDADFMRSTFTNGAEFSVAKFRGDVYFDGVLFDKAVDFIDTKFGKVAYFVGLSTTDSTEMDFQGAILPDTLNFSLNPKLKGNVDLLNCDFTNRNATTNLLLYGSNISGIKLDYVHFKVLLLDSFRLHGHVYRFTTEDKKVVFERLLENFKASGQTVSHDLCDIDYQLFKWHDSKLAFFPCVPFLWNKFGYEKEKVFVWTFWFLFIFTIANFWLLDYLNENIYPMSTIPATSGIRNPVRRLWYSFVYTSSVFFRLTLKLENLNFQRVLGTLYLIIIYTLGVICLAYMAGYVLQK